MSKMNTKKKKEDKNPLNDKKNFLVFKYKIFLCIFVLSRSLGSRTRWVVYDTMGGIVGLCWSGNLENLT